MLLDSHCHLDQFSDPEFVLDEAATRGVERVVAVAENPDSMEAILKLREKLGERVLIGLGLHPAWVTQQDDAPIESGLEYLEANLHRADLLGEVGLDFKWAETPEQQQLQLSVLDRQFALAARLRTPVNLHSRRCLRQVMEKAIDFHKQTGLNAQLHWFTQSKKLVRICNQEGLYVSVGPTVLRDAGVQEVAAEISDDLLLLESDAPVRIAGVEGHPAQVREIAERLAEIKSRTWKEIGSLCAENHARYLAGK